MDCCQNPRACPPISRRDFLNGAALTIAAGLTPAAQIAAQPLRYPPALTGLRGQHPGSFETAHAQAYDRGRYPLDAAPVEERYDLVVVGAGISGLAAAWFYRRAAGPSARILVLDNHDDFGGHAKRNEFTLDGRLVLGYGGSESIDSPRTHYSDVAKVASARPRGRDRAVRERLRSQVLCVARPCPRRVLSARSLRARRAGARRARVGRSRRARACPANARPLGEFIAAFPIAPESKAQLRALYDGARDPLAGKTIDEKRDILKSTSYRDYLTRICGCSEEVANCFQGRTLGFFGLGCDAVPAADARDLGYPGFDGLGLAGAIEPAREPYIYHFPDGNASLARLLVRSLLPDAAPGHSMDDVVLAPFDYGKLDRDGQNRAHPPRLDLRRRPQRRRHRARRLCARGSAASGRGQHAVLACFHMVIPHIMPELSAAAARGARAQRQDAARLHQRADARLASRGCGWACTTLPRRCRFTPG